MLSLDLQYFINPILVPINSMKLQVIPTKYIPLQGIQLDLYKMCSLGHTPVPKQALHTDYFSCGHGYRAPFTCQGVCFGEDMVFGGCSLPWHEPVLLI